MHLKTLPFVAVKRLSRRRHRWIWSGRTIGIITAVGFALVLGGCGKREPTNQAVATQPVVDTNQSSASLPPPSNQATMAAPVIAMSPNGGADLRQLNHAYIGWIVQNRRRPKNFDDYIASSGIQIPPAPDGKKYIIDKNGFIALVPQ